MQDHLLASATRLASTYGFAEVLPEHILYAISMCDEGREAITECGYSYASIRVRLLESFKVHLSNHIAESDPSPSAAALGVLERVEVDTQLKEREYFKSIIKDIKSNSQKKDFLHSVLQKSVRKALKGKITFNDMNSFMENDLDGILDEISDKIPEQNKHLRHDAFTGEYIESDKENSLFRPDVTQEKPSKKQHSIETQSAKMDEENRKAVLSAHRNLSEEARNSQLDVIAGRDQELARIMEILMRRRKPNILLVAEPGVGKTALVHGLAQFIIESELKTSLSERPVKEVSLTSMVAGTRLRGDFEARMSLMVQLAEEENAILFIDEFHTIMGSGASLHRGMDGANIIKPALARDRMSLIGATTPEEAIILREDKALMRRFEIVYLKEPNRADMYNIMSKSANSFLQKHNVMISPPEINRCLDLGSRHLPTRRNPDRSFDVIDLAGVSAAMRHSSHIESQDILYAIERLGAKIPRLSSSREFDWVSFEKDFSQSFMSTGDFAFHFVRKIRQATNSLDVEPITLYGPNGSGRRFSTSIIASLLKRSLHNIELPSDRSEDLSYAQARISLALEADPKAVICVRLPSRDALKIIRDYLTSGRIYGSDGALISAEDALIFILAFEAEEASPIGFSSVKGDEKKVTHHKVVFEPLDYDGMRQAARICLSLINHDYDIGIPRSKLEDLLGNVMAPLGESAYWSEIYESALRAFEALPVHHDNWDEHEVDCSF